MRSSIPTTPCLIYDAAALRRQYKRLRAFLNAVYRRHRVFYALKACYVPPVVAELLKLGAGLEVSTPAELGIAEFFGLDGHDLVWNAPALAADTLDRLIARRAHIHVDSLAQWNQVCRALEGKKEQPALGLRLNVLGQGKFGLTPEQAERCLASPRVPAITGMHLHRLPSDTLSQERVQAEKLLLLDWVARWERRFGLRVRYVDFGGGFVSDRAFWRAVGRRLRTLASRPELFVEPGSFLVREAGVAFTRVLSRKIMRRSRWLIADLGGHVLTPADPALASRRASATRVASAAVAGPFCFESDVLARGVPAGIETGEIVAIPSCGAYSISWASAFGAFPPAVYWKEGTVLVPVRPPDTHHRAFMAFHGYPATGKPR